MPRIAPTPELHRQMYRTLLSAAHLQRLPLTPSQIEVLAHAAARTAESVAPPLHGFGPVPGFKQRQVQILVGIARGATNGQIARALGIREDTVKTHVQILFERLNVDNRTAAAVLALRLRIISLDDVATSPREL